MEHIFVQSLIQIVFCSLLVAMLLISKRFMTNAIAILIIIEMVVAIQLNAFYTVASEWKSKELHTWMKQLPEAFPIPEGKVSENTDGRGMFLPVWRNTGIFHKRISRQGFSSFCLNDYLNLLEKYPQLTDVSLNNDFIYFTPDVFSNDELSENPPDSFLSSFVFIPDRIHARLNKDSFMAGSKDKIEVLDFSPVQIKARITTEQTQLLVLLQSFYPGWELYINGEQSRIIKANILFMSAVIDKGEHEIEFVYKNKTIVYAFILSVFFLLVVLVMLFLPERKISTND